MADARRRDGLAELAGNTPPSRWVTLRPLPHATRLILRGGSDVPPAVNEAFGVSLPVTACRAATSGGRSALWLGPDKWLLLAPVEEASELRSALVTALAALPSSLVDISHRNAALEVSGTRPAEVLNAFVPLDLELAAFPAGMCTRTLLGKAEIVLWRTAAQDFRIEVARSFAPYVWACLEEARREHLD